MELNDIQGLLIRGHANMDAAEYLMLQITDSAATQAWLREMLPRITHGAVKPPDQCLQVAFTWTGLLKLGIDNEWALDFRPEFVQGLDTEYRARILGDLEESESKNWNWGNKDNNPVDMVLMHFNENSESIGPYSKELEKGLAKGGLQLVARLDTSPNPLLKEHFGFRDGISQPIVAGLKKKGTHGDPEVPAGEFLLGYENAHRELPDTPAIPASLDPEGILPVAPGRQDHRDLGKNGSYMVFRQLRQDVKGFWNFAVEAVKRENPEAGHAEAIQLAAKMVGRWPSGAPVTCFPDRDEPEHALKNDFTYFENDQEGYKCPMGSHVRRSNPRDSLVTNSPEKALKISQRHRILRRGRIFGPPLHPDFDPVKFLDSPDDGEVRGLHFICFNTNIAAQFEFIQHTWTDNTKFQGMYNDPDPVLGIKDSRNKKETHDFTMPGIPLRRKVQGLSRQVQVMGGAYFFMPGIRGLRFLANFDPKKL